MPRYVQFPGVGYDVEFDHEPSDKELSDIWSKMKSDPTWVDRNLKNKLIGMEKVPFVGAQLKARKHKEFHKWQSAPVANKDKTGDPSVKYPYHDIIKLASEKYGVPHTLISSVVEAESKFDPKARSVSGASGLMQLMPKTAKQYGATDLHDPQQNIDAGTKYLSELLRQYKGNTQLALAAYNAGPTNVNKYGGIPPFEETRSYVDKVMNLYKIASQ